MLISDIAIFALIGSISGIFAGALGIGGGLIVVPALNFYFASNNLYDSPYLVASSTSLLIMVFTTLSGTISHLRYKTVDISVIPYALIGAVTGSFLGRSLIILLTNTDKRISNYTFLCLVFYVGYKLIRGINKESIFSSAHDDYFRSKIMYAVFIVSTIGAWHGVGVGAILVPWLLSKSMDQKNATALSTVCNFILATSSTLFMIMLINNASYGSMLTVISLEAVASIGIVSFVTAPIGVILTRKIQPRIFKLVMLFFMFSLALQQITNFYNFR